MKKKVETKREKAERLTNELKDLMDRQRTESLKQLTKAKKDPRIQEIYDMIQVLIIMPEYQKDCSELDDLAGIALKTDNPKDEEQYWKKENEICKKYRISTPICDESELKWLDVQGIKEFFHDPPIVTVIKANKYRELRDKNGKLIGFDFSPCLFDGKYLMLQIDLSKKKQSILAGVNETIDYYIKHVKREKTRNKRYTYPPWEIYKMRHKERLSFVEIAKRLSGIDENPTYNPEVNKIYKAVKRSYDKALEIIKKL
ncbi:MAG: hypothetical protein HY805_00165 [Nitrospirae bacterium]|nr:hypothetical protein [Nitrospirota bacterium]